MDALARIVSGGWVSSLYWSENKQNLYWNWHILRKAFKDALARFYTHKNDNMWVNNTSFIFNCFHIG